MKKILMIFSLSLLSAGFAAAQLGGFANKIRNKVSSKLNQRVDEKLDKQINEGLDVAEGKQASSTKAAAVPHQASSGEAPRSYSKFDFVPGEKILYAPDFRTDEIGQLPAGWNTQGKAELVTIEQSALRWLRLFPTAVYLTNNAQSFDKNFTVEFDLLLDMKNTGYSYPYFSFGFISSGDQPAGDNSLLSGYRRVQSAEIYFRLSSGGTTSTYMESYEAGKRTFITETQQLPTLEEHYGKLSHIAIQVQESRLRLWVDGEKKFDLPKALPVSNSFNNLFFRTHSSSYKENQLGFYISNIRVATGISDTRHKLVEEGKFSTTGILFDVNAATIKPESMGTVREIASVLAKYPSIKIQIIGHTDAEGSKASNMELSEKRALAVKVLLKEAFNIDPGRMETAGKGASEPIAENKTTEGRAQNRRVEFIKSAN